MSRRAGIKIISLFLFLSAASLSFAAGHISKDVPIGTIPASAGLGSSRVSRIEALAKFVKANFQYKDGHYDEAIKLYDEVVNGGLASGPLYYNLANSYFQKGSLGKAILNYERAGRLMPRDHDLAANYQYARSLVKNPEIVETSSVFKKLYWQFLDLFSLNEMVLFVFVMGVAIGAIYLLSLYFAWRRPVALRILIPLIFLFLIFLSGCFNKLEMQQGTAVVVADTAARFEPRAQAPVHFDLPQGNQIKILKIDGAWAKIKRPDGKEGWVSAADIEKIEQNS